MTLIKDDLAQIEKVVERAIKPLKEDIAEMKLEVAILRVDVTEMKKDLNLLATINQLEEIKKDKRLMRMFSA